MTAPCSSRPLIRQTRDGVAFLTSPTLSALGIPHAFSTRVGGVSEGAFSTLNLGNPATAPHDAPANLEENWRRLLTAAGFATTSRQEVHQVHGCEVARVETGTRLPREKEADALVSSDPETPIAVRVADCCPLLLATDDGRRVAAVHAGWRGLIAGVIEQAIDALNAPPASLLAAVGPCIGFDAFEVGPEVLEAFRKKFGDGAPLRNGVSDAKGHVDLCAAAVLSLEGAGVHQVDAAFLCTVANQADFFSHRRDQGHTGRMAAVIAPAAHRPRT